MIKYTENSTRTQENFKQEHYHCDSCNKPIGQIETNTEIGTRWVSFDGYLYCPFCSTPLYKDNIIPENFKRIDLTIKR